MQLRSCKAEHTRDGHSEFANVQGALAELTIVSPLGSGNFGEVRLAVHAPTRRAFALKEQRVDAKQRAAVDREIAAMRHGASPCLVRFYGEAEQRDGAGHTHESE